MGFPITMATRDALQELWRYRYLLRMLVQRELKIRYKNSMFGILWSAVPLLLQVMVYTFLFRNVVGVKVENFSAYLLCGVIPWTFFSTAILDASQSLLINYPILRKVYMPREVIPLANVISNFIHFMIGWSIYFSVFAVLARLAGAGIPLLPTMAWFPIICFIEALLVTGFSLYAAILNVFYEDVKFLLQTLFQLAFFILPVLYPADQIYYTSHIIKAHPWLYKVYLLDPIASVITAFRSALLQPINPSNYNKSLTGLHPLPFDWAACIGATLISIFIAWSGYAYFNSRKWQIVERP